MHIKPIYILTAILTLAAIYFYQDPQWNGNSRLDAVKAVVEQGKFNIDAYQAQPDWATGDKVFFKGHYYLDKAPGVSLLAIPFYFIIYKISTALGIALKASFIKHSLTTLIIETSFIVNGLVMYESARLISPNLWKAFVVSLSVSLGTMLWPYSAVFYGHVPAAMFLCIAFYLLFMMSRAPEKIAFRRFFWAGLCLGFAFIIDYTTASIIVGLMLYAIYILRKQNIFSIIRYGIGGALGALIPLSLLSLWNFLNFGNPIILGYTYYSTNPSPSLGLLYSLFFYSPSLSALYHLTFDPQFGLFWQSPVLLLAFVGCFIAARTKSYRAEILVFVYTLAITLFLNSGIEIWWSGHAFGPRYLIAALPFFIIPLMLIPDSFLWLVGALGIISATQMLIPLMGQIQIAIDWIASRNQFWVDSKPFTGFSVLWQYGLPLILKSFQSSTPSWTLGYAIRFIPYRLYLSLPILVGAEAFLISLFYKQTKTESLQT